VTHDNYYLHSVDNLNDICKKDQLTIIYKKYDDFKHFEKVRTKRNQTYKNWDQ